VAGTQSPMAEAKEERVEVEDGEAVLPGWLASADAHLHALREAEERSLPPPPSRRRILRAMHKGWRAPPLRS